MPALYRTYRPKRFSEVVGQSHIVRTLKNAVVADSPAHAYLFCGGRGLGKTTLARIMARALNCLEVKDGEACLTCRVCREIDAGSFLDLLEVDAASNTGVDNVRALIDTVRFQPTSGKYKMYIIDEAHMLSKGAWNALLKTLEEPPSRTVFVMATTEIGKVPATINSRAQAFTFNKFSDAELVGQLEVVAKQEQRNIEPSVLNLIAHTAEGGMRDALTLLDQVFSLGDQPAMLDVERLLGKTGKHVLCDLLSIISKGSAGELPQFFQTLTTTYFDMQAVNRDLLELLRELLVARLTGRAIVELQDYAGEYNNLSETDLLFLIRQYLRSYKEISGSPDGSLPLLIASLEGAYKMHAPLKAPTSEIRAAPVEQTLPQQSAPAPTSMSASHVVSAAAHGSLPTKGESHSVTPGSAVPLQQTSVLDSPFILNEQQVRDAWPDACNKLKDVNGPLGTLVRNSPICVVEGNSISIGVKYLFHKEKLESVKNKQLISQSLSEFFGGPVRVIAQFIERDESSGSVGETLSDALKIFGGELVE